MFSFCIPTAASIALVFSIFSVNSHDILTENIQSIYRICLSVHDQVCRIKVNSHISFSDSFLNILDRTL